MEFFARVATMPNLPTRSTIHDQLVAMMRDAIETARWRGEMPSEAELCREFQVCRTTLRKALARLAAERWIEPGGRGRLHRILKRPRKRTVSSARTVRLLTPFGFSVWNSSMHLLMEELWARLSAAEYRLELEHHPGVFKKFQSAKLEHLDALPDTAAWLVMYSTEPIQRWFAARGRPTVLLGRVHDGLALSSIHPDPGAVARHAAGLLHSRGHRELVYLIATLTSIGDRDSSEVFTAEARRLGARARIVSYEAGAEALSKVMKDLIASRPRPTGYAVGAPETAITALCHLQAAGIRVPSSASVVCMWDDVHLGFTYPSIAHYRTDGRVFGRKVAGAVLDLIRHGAGKVRTESIVPDYVPGGSVGRLR
jgi:DNA-binding LacI/PurR family transcriptional regulator